MRCRLLHDPMALLYDGMNKPRPRALGEGGDMFIILGDFLFSNFGLPYTLYIFIFLSSHKREVSQFRETFSTKLSPRLAWA